MRIPEPHSFITATRQAIFPTLCTKAKTIIMMPPVVLKHVSEADSTVESDCSHWSLVGR